MIVAAITVALAGCAPDLGVRPRTSVSEGVLQSDALLGRVLEQTAPGCSAAVGIKGEVVWAGARGLADLETASPLTTRSVFDIASVTKQFTATAILLLETDGALEMSDTLAVHVEGLPDWARNITVQELLHHRSGIPDYTALLTSTGINLADGATQQDALRTLRSADLDFAPGERFAYSNSNYILLAEVVREVAGVPLPEYLEARIFTPLDLDMRMDPAFAFTDVATPYERVNDTFVVARSHWGQIGDGSLFTTPTELVRWADSYRTHEVLAQDTLVHALDSAPSTGDPTGSRYGPGIQIAQDGSLSHIGGWGQYTTIFGISADRAVAIAVSCNSFAVDPLPIAEGLRVVWVVETSPTGWTTSTAIPLAPIERSGPRRSQRGSRWQQHRADTSVVWTDRCCRAMERSPIDEPDLPDHSPTPEEDILSGFLVLCHAETTASRVDAAVCRRGPS